MTLQEQLTAALRIAQEEGAEAERCALKAKAHLENAAALARIAETLQHHLRRQGAS